MGDGGEGKGIELNYYYQRFRLFYAGKVKYSESSGSFQVRKKKKNVGKLLEVRELEDRRNVYLYFRLY